MQDAVSVALEAGPFWVWIFGYGSIAGTSRGGGSAYECQFLEVFARSAVHSSSDSNMRCGIRMSQTNRCLADLMAAHRGSPEGCAVLRLCVVVRL
jgi:hypothetical protein